MQCFALAPAAAEKLRTQIPLSQIRANWCQSVSSIFLLRCLVHRRFSIQPWTSWALSHTSNYTHLGIQACGWAGDSVQFCVFTRSSTLMRRGVRVVEGARLESVCRGNLTAGSNPALSATYFVYNNIQVILAALLSVAV